MGKWQFNIFSSENEPCSFIKVQQMNTWPNTNAQICLFRCMKLFVWFMEKAFIKIREPGTLLMNIWHESLEVFSSLFFSGGRSEYKVLCLLGWTKARPWGNYSFVEDFLSRISVWIKTMLPSVVDAVSSVTTDSAVWKNESVFTETDLLQDLTQES